MKENSKETVQWHMYGLTKIFELRGPHNIRSDTQPDRNLLLGCLTLSVSSKTTRQTENGLRWNDYVLTKRRQTTLTCGLDWMLLFEKRYVFLVTETMEGCH